MGPGESLAAADRIFHETQVRFPDIGERGTNGPDESLEMMEKRVDFFKWKRHKV